MQAEVSTRGPESKTARPPRAHGERIVIQEKWRKGGSGLGQFSGVPTAVLPWRRRPRSACDRCPDGLSIQRGWQQQRGGLAGQWTADSQAAQTRAPGRWLFSPKAPVIKGASCSLARLGSQAEFARGGIAAIAYRSNCRTGEPPQQGESHLY
jgi:hypothetical protein